IALFCQSSAFPRNLVCFFTSVALSWGIFLIGEVTLIGYASGFPPVLGTSEIPPAVLTAFAFLLTSASTLLLSMTQSRPYRLPAGTKDIDTRWWWAVTVAVIGVGVAAALRSAIVGGVGGDILPYVTFYPAVLVIALFTGLVGGLLSTLLAALYVQVWLHGGLLSGTEWLALTVFLIGCTITSLICEAARQSRAAERRTGTRLKRVVADLEQAADALQQSEKKFRSVFE
ncbi:MAG: hypothetical protein WBM40_01395, partial [Thiohalocapsa sp.]